MPSPIVQLGIPWPLRQELRNRAADNGVSVEVYLERLLAAVETAGQPTLRLPRALQEVLERRARSHGVSPAQYIEQMLLFSSNWQALAPEVPGYHSVDRDAREYVSLDGGTEVLVIWDRDEAAEHRVDRALVCVDGGPWLEFSPYHLEPTMPDDIASGADVDVIKHVLERYRRSTMASAETPVATPSTSPTSWARIFLDDPDADAPGEVGP